MTYITPADTAKLIRSELKRTFPGVKFSVRTSTYSGGASIDVSWTDGPADSTVRGVTDRFRGADFDGQTDSMNYLTRTTQDGSSIRYGADFVFTHRSVSTEAMAAARADLNRHMDDNEQREFDLADLTGRWVTAPAVVWAETSCTEGSPHMILNVWAEHLANIPA